MIFRARNFSFTFPRPALIMGIINVTPDSFSDGGQFFDKDRAIAHALQLAAEGADILDIGGESTRPGAASVSEAEELRRVLPVVQTLAATSALPISIDTRKATVAREALAAGVSIVNDIGAYRRDESMWHAIAESGAGYVIMHMKGTPETMASEAHYENVVKQVDIFFSETLESARSTGILSEQIVLDPGLGFAKTSQHNFQLLAALKRFKVHQRPVLVGASRKSFLGKWQNGGAVQGRLGGSLACAVWAVLNDVQIVRTHDVAATVQAVRVIEEIQAHAKE